MTTLRKQAYAALDSERAYQDFKWGQSASSGGPGNGNRTLDEFILYISGYADELKRIGSTESDPRKKLDFVRKVGGLAVACMEQHGAPRREGF